MVTLPHQTFSQHPLIEMSIDSWYESFRVMWKQSQHVALQGPTGVGKSRLAHRLLEIREWVCVLAIKRKDDTLERFRDGPRYGYSRYKVVHSWPPDYGYQKVVLWEKPKSLDAADLARQAKAVHRALNRMYIEGGWCIYFDEAGYISSTLGLANALGVLLNQGRSAYLSIVASMTRPSSVVARIPRETFTQVKHHIIFKYTDRREMKSAAEISGLDFSTMQAYQEKLQVHGDARYSDFLHVDNGTVTLVRNNSKE